MNKERGKSEELFVELYNTHVDAIFRFCYFKTGDREVAKDLTQDTFIKAFKYLGKGEIKNAKSFIYTIAKNTVIDFWRKKKSIPESHLPEGFFEYISEKNNPTIVDTDVDYYTFLLLLEKLSPIDREVIVLRFVEDMSPKDMAKLLGGRENTILVRISRAKEKLRQLLKEAENQNG